MDGIGIICVEDERIVVSMQRHNESIKTGFHEVTVENLNEAARLLASWMDLKHEDIAIECQRIHKQDQALARFRECITRYKEGD